jgi:hypothetical protein
MPNFPSLSGRLEEKKFTHEGPFPSFSLKTTKAVEGDRQNTKVGTIFQEIEKRAIDGTSGQQIPHSSVDLEVCHRKTATSSPTNDPKIQAQSTVLPSRSKVTMTSKPTEKTTLPKSPTSTPKNPIESPHLHTPLSQRSRRVETPAETPKSNASPAPKITPNSYAYDILPPQSIAANIRRILRQKEVPEPTGTLYVLEAPSFFDSFKPASDRNEKWVKIGISKDVGERVKSLKMKCGITDIRQVYVTDACNISMRLMKVIEAVCHAELNNFRRKMDCRNERVTSKCDTVHEEWFAVDTEVAIRTAKRWRSFLDHKPYGKYGVLHEFWVGRLDDEDYGRFGDSEGEEEYDLMSKAFDLWLQTSRDRMEKESSAAS